MKYVLQRSVVNGHREGCPAYGEFQQMRNIGTQAHKGFYCFQRDFLFGTWGRCVCMQTGSWDEGHLDVGPASQRNKKHKNGIWERQDGIPRRGPTPVLVCTHHNLAMMHPVWFTIKFKQNGTHFYFHMGKTESLINKIKKKGLLENKHKELSNHLFMFSDNSKLRAWRQSCQ